MEEKEFIQLVKEMRNAQRYNLTIEAKALEAKVDEYIRRSEWEDRQLTLKF